MKKYLICVLGILLISCAKNSTPNIELGNNSDTTENNQAYTSENSDISASTEQENNQMQTENVDDLSSAEEVSPENTNSAPSTPNEVEVQTLEDVVIDTTIVKDDAGTPLPPPPPAVIMPPLPAPIEGQ